MLTVAARVAEATLALVLERLGVNARAVVETGHGHAGRLDELRAEFGVRREREHERGERERRARDAVDAHALVRGAARHASVIARTRVEHARVQVDETRGTRELRLAQTLVADLIRRIENARAAVRAKLFHAFLLRCLAAIK